ncbi:MAG: PQQ-dependent sugar dehydrogenase [Saprospiraceae bacterium]|nr:PQQ-dependent sugar dehydrogenase [Saprospiraceae bacterium]
MKTHFQVSGSNSYLSVGILFLSAMILLCVQARAQILLDSTYINVSTVAQNIFYPWEIIWGPDNSIWMTQQGKVSRVNPQTGAVKKILDVPDYAFGEGSRQMGLALHPDFSTNKYVFVDYNYVGDFYNEPKHHHLYMKIVRYTYNASRDALENPMIIIDGIKIFDGYHDGGKMIISDDHIFLTIGDAKQVEFPNLHPYVMPGDASLPQNLEVLNGKIVRLNMDGSVPHDNPFAKSPFEKTSRNLIWSYGHRNTQGLVVGKANKLYYAEHGRENDDEMGVIEKGMNYGWPLIEGFCDLLAEARSCDTVHNHQEPLVSWNPNVAPSNMEYVGNSSIGEFQNSILVGTLTGDNFGNHIAVLTLNETGDYVVNERILFFGEYGRIRDLCIDPSGNIYFITSNTTAGSGSQGDDRIMKISFDSKKVITGVTETIQSDIDLYPNPLGNERKIYLKLPFSKGVVQLYNATGEVIETYLTERDSFVIDASHLKTGIYFIHYTTATKLEVRKVIVD